MTPPMRPTALTRQEHGHAEQCCETCYHIIRRLDVDLLRARAEIDKLAPTVLALEEEKVRLDARVGELGREIDVTAGEEREEAHALVMEWDDLAHAASHSMPWEQQRAMLVARVASALAACRPARVKRGNP